MRNYISLSLLLFIGFIAFVQPVHATTTYSPIVIEPYDDESLRIISSSLGAFKSNFDRVKDDKAALISAFQQNKANPTPENTANVTEKAGQVLYTTVEFVKNGQESIDRAIPELRKYRKYLQKVSASMEGDDPLLSDRAKQVEKEAENIEKLLTDLEKAEKDLQLIKSDLVMLTRAWLHSEQIQRELRKSFGGGKIGSIHKELSGVVDTLSEVRGIITDLLSENSLGCSSEEYAEGVDQYRSSVRNYFRGARR